MISISFGCAGRRRTLAGCVGTGDAGGTRLKGTAGKRHAAMTDVGGYAGKTDCASRKSQDPDSERGAMVLPEILVTSKNGWDYLSHK